MTELVRCEIADGLAVLTMDNPPLNALGHALRLALSEAFARAEADAAVQVVCLAAAGRSWPVGADVREFGQPPVPPTLPQLCARIAAADKPVIAALHGTVLGGGLELALVCALRVAAAGTEFGLPEASLGILPGAGGTQRLPRLIGAEAALDLMLSGRRIDARRAREIGLIDGAVPGGAVEAARTIAAAHVGGQSPLPAAAHRKLPGMADPAAYLAAVAAERARPRPAHERAQPRIVDCVEAALLLPPDEGLIVERSAFEELVATPEARALRHAFLAERRGARSLPAPEASPVPLRRVAVAGGGAIGAGLATGLAERGLEVVLIEADEAALSRALGRIARSQDAAAGKGLLSPEKRAADWARIVPALSVSAAAGADLAIEAVSENVHVKEGVLAGLAAALRPDAAILSVTCGLDPRRLAEAAGPGRAHASLWLAEPVGRAELVEVALPDDARAAGAARALARVFGWRLLGRDAGAGFLGGRCRTALQDAADRMVLAGATPHAVDLALRAFGLPFGPFELRDLYGLDHVLSRPAVRRAGGDALDGLAAWLAGAGRAGRRAGKGYHLYPEPGRRPQADPEVEGWLERLRPPAALPPERAGRMLIAGLANDGAWALAEGRARTPSDIDLVAMAQGFPRWRGGPMQAADAAGLLDLRTLLRQLAADGDGYWRPAPLWDELIKNGRRFAELNPD